MRLPLTKTITATPLVATTDCGDGGGGDDGVGAGAVGRCANRHSLPRLEEWPGFPRPDHVFARSAPAEAQAGVLPPSKRLLGLIHQVRRRTVILKGVGGDSQFVFTRFPFYFINIVHSLRISSAFVVAHRSGLVLHYLLVLYACRLFCRF